MTDGAALPPPRRPFGQRTNRVLFYGMLVGLALVFAAFASNSELVFIGLPLVLVCAGALFVGPAVALALPPFRSRPAAERVPQRFPALLSGVGVAAISVFWARAAEGPAAFAAGLALTAAGGWTVAQAVGLPRVAPAGGDEAVGECFERWRRRRTRGSRSWPSAPSQSLRGRRSGRTSPP